MPEEQIEDDGGDSWELTEEQKEAREHNLQGAENFAQNLMTYLEHTKTVRRVIRSMARIVVSEDADDDERLGAAFTMTEAMFPEGFEGEEQPDQPPETNGDVPKE